MSQKMEQCQDYINHHENGHRECIYFACIAACNARFRLARLWGIKPSSNRILGISELSLSCRSGNNVIVYHTENHTGLLSRISIWCKCQSRSYPMLQIKETTLSYGWVHFTILMRKDNTLTYLFTISLSIMSCISSQQLQVIQVYTSLSLCCNHILHKIAKGQVSVPIW